MSNSIKKAQDAHAFLGLEIGVFKLKCGLPEKAMINAANNVERKFLNNEDGFLSHYLIKGDNQIYADLVFARSKLKAEQICKKWLYNEYTQKYFEYIDPESVDISFWTVINKG